MKRILIAILGLMIFNIFSATTTLALSNETGSDPTGKSQRYIIENAPWFDPTACATSNASLSSNLSTQRGKTYIIGDSITSEGTNVANKIKLGLKGAGFDPLIINSKVSRSLSVGDTDLNGISILEKDVNNWKDANNIIVELGTNGGLTDENIKNTIDKIKASNPKANIYWINVGVNNNSRQNNSLNDVGYAQTLDKNKSLGYQIIDWKSVVDKNPDYITNDGYGVHPYTQNGSQAYADTILNSLKNPTPNQDNAIKSSCSCPVGVVNTGFKGNNNVETAFNFFNGRQGISAAQSAGIVGNFMRESGENLDTSALNQDGSASFGIAQWLGGRKEGLINFARDQGKDPTDLTVQLEYVMVELNGPYKNSVLEPLLKANNPEEAAIIWEDKYEVSADVVGDSGMAKRINYANQVFDLYGKNAPGSYSLSGCTNNPGSIGQAPNGFVFPVITTKQAIMNGNESGAKWCYQSSTSCHHDYPAADIMINEGTVVVASVGGKVVGAQQGCPGNCGVVIKGNDQNVYYYTHMGAGTITVKQGDLVNAGQPIGKVGNSADAENTSPHLHFNIMNSKWDYMPTCYNSNCPNIADMIDPQPWLLSAYQNLPE